MVAQQAPPNGAPVDPATALYREKLKLAGELNCRPLLADLLSRSQALYRLERNRLDLEAKLQAAKAGVAEAETMAALNAVCDGKNEPERKLQRERAVQQDVGYQNACLEMRRAEAELARHGAETDLEKREARRLEREIEYRTAALRFLGG